jgi:hypothetical protein
MKDLHQGKIFAADTSIYLHKVTGLHIEVVKWEAGPTQDPYISLNLHPLTTAERDPEPMEIKLFGADSENIPLMIEEEDGAVRHIVFRVPPPYDPEDGESQ